MTEDDDEHARLVGNAQTKLTATYMNGVAIAVFAVGGFGPLVTVLLSSASGFSFPAAIAFSVICQLASLAIHIAARRFLRKLVR